jgi:glycosyltransferase involved in cell wall biosynthesis
MRILQVVNVRWYNATAWYAVSLSRLLAQAGHQVKVLALPGTDSFRRARQYGLDICPMVNTANPAHLLREGRRLRNLIQEFRPHVVNCHRGEGMPLWALLKDREPPFALVRTRGDQRLPRANMVNRYLHARRCDAVIATNSRTMARCRELFGLTDEALFMIPGGVDTWHFAFNPQARVALRLQYGIADNELALGLVGRFDPVKGHRELFDALVMIRESLRRVTPDGTFPCRLMLLGFAAHISVDHMREMLQERGLADSCIITDRVETVPEHMSCLDLAVVPSQGSEAIARAALELMSCGVPLVGTDVGVMPDLLSPTALAPVGDAEALAKLLFRALTDENFRLRLKGEQAAGMGRFSRETFLAQTLAVYEMALRRSGRTVLI